ncbi:MAG: 4'-phosphopantetheinyl transferase superfamily protein [Treponema sp.]|nr:4'-phosphopantetheinyl transferase superfamily protein [Treponema sp.]
MFNVVILTVKSELSQEDFDTLLPLVSPEKLEQLKRFCLTRDIQNSLLGDILTRMEICRVIGLSNEQLVFCTGPLGKPFLVNDLHLHFSISHAGDYTACAVADKPVGIDIELIRNVDLRIAERLCTLDEMDYIMEGPQMQRFYEVWTKKECRIKWEGKGLHKPLPSFSVFNRFEPKQPVYHEVFNNGEALCYVCSAKQDTPSVRIINTDMLMNTVLSGSHQYKNHEAHKMNLIA